MRTDPPLVEPPHEGDGLRRIGWLEFTSDRLAFAGSLWSAFGLIAYIAVAPYRRAPATWEPIAIGLGILCLGCILYYLLPRWLLKNAKYRVTVHLDTGPRIRLKHRSDQVTFGKAKTQSEFRPCAIEGGKTQVELRRNWKGRNEWLVFVPNEIPDDALEEHLARYLPLLSETVEAQAMN